MTAGTAAAGTRRGTARQSGQEAQRAASRRRQRAERRERTIMGQPARFMMPRIVLVVCVAFLVLFGLLMIYSSSSITAMTSEDYGYDPTYFLQNQARNIMVGLVLGGFAVSRDYHVWSRSFLPVLWVGTVLLVLAVHTPLGHAEYGASRWVYLGPIGLQPSEFAKPVMVLTGASLFSRYYEEGSIDLRSGLLRLGLFVGIPLFLVLLEPDKGSTLIIAATLLVMLTVAGLPGRVAAGLAAVGIVGFLALSFLDSYSRARMITMLDPWSDRFGDGYQLIQGWYAFGSGGLLGQGIGFSHQKYSYLPMAYNDFIFAVVGEECGLVGTVAIVVVFLVMVWASFRIARYAPDLTGRLIACGCSSMLFIQMFVNVGGVLGIIPLSGKTIPFLSYGGSSIIASLLLVGLILSVSRASILPETPHDRARRSMSLAGEGRDEASRGGVGQVTRRSQRTGAAGLTVLQGGAQARPRTRGRARDGRPDVRVVTDSHGRERIELGADPASRLRRDDGPVVRTRDRGDWNGRRSR